MSGSDGPPPFVVASASGAAPPTVAAVKAARLVGSTAVALGVVIAVVGIRSRPAELRAGPTGFVNADYPGINAHNSPAVAVDPARPAVMAVADRIDTPNFSCSVARSTDAGASWRPLPLPLPGEGLNCYWPDVAFDDDHRLLVLYTPYTATRARFNHPDGVWLQPFDGESASGSPVRVAGPGAHHARMAVDGHRVVVSWVQTGQATADIPVGFAPAPNPVMLARSDDGGRSFSPPVRVSEPERLVVQPSVLIGKDGQLVVGALDLGDDLLDYEARHESQGGPPADGRWRVVAWRSTDGGASFRAASVVSELVIPQRIIVDLAPTPGFAVDEMSGRIYATWDAGRGDERDVFLAWSDDGGGSWSAPKRIAPRPRAQFLPAVAVAPNGRVDVVFYDRSQDPADELAEVALASSWDGARSFWVATVSDRSFDSGIGFGSAQGIPVLSSQLALHADARGASAFWADTRRGTLDSNAQDLAFSIVELRRPPGRRWLLGAVGALLLMAGAVLLAGPAFSARRRRRHAEA